MNRVLKLLNDKKQALESELAFDQLMLDENRGTESVKETRRKCVWENEVFIGQINKAIFKITQ